jgi:hypothetical protein
VVSLISKRACPFSEARNQARDGAFRRIRLAESIGSHTLDDLKRLRAVSGRCLVAKLQRDVLNEVGRVIEAGGYGWSDLAGTV